MLEPKIKKRLSRVLSKWHVTPDDLDNFIKELDEEPDDEADPEANPEKGEPAPENAGAEKADPAPEAEGKGAKPEENPVPPKPEEAPADPIPEEKPEPSPEQTPAAPADQGKYEELQKAVEGLSAKLDGMVDALKQSGVLSVVDKPSAGVEKNDLPGGPVEGDMQSTLSEINRGRKY